MWVFLATVVAVAQAAPWWPLKTTVGQQAQAFSELTKNQNVLATCNYVLVKEYVDFDTAEQRCKDLKIGVTTTGQGNLATVNTESKNDELSDLMKIAYGQTVTGGWRFDNSNWCWIGLRKVTNNLMGGMSLAAQKQKALELKGVFTASDWKWEDGSDCTWSYWMNTQPDGKPDDEGNLQNQVRMYKKGFWDDSYGFNEHPFACDYRGKYIIVEEPKYVSDAEIACLAAGMTLAKIRSKEENEEFVEAAKLFLPNHQWDDYLPYNSTNWIWIGANDLTDGVYKFSDGDPIEFDIPWRPHQPDNADNHGFGRNEHYVAVSVSGQWDDSYGEDRMRPFACMCPDS